jgi:hypothetical protein
MIRHICLSILFIALALPASTLNAQLSDRELVMMMTQQDVLVWERAARTIRDAESEIRSANRILQQKQPGIMQTQDDIRQMHSRARESIANANQRIQASRQIQTNLRQRYAAKAGGGSQAGAAPVTTSYTLDMPQIGYRAFIESEPVHMMRDLWQAGILRIYNGGVWRILPDGTYRNEERINEIITRTIIQFDTGRFSFRPTPEFEFTINAVNDKPEVMFPDKTRLIAETPTALIYHEIIPDGSDWIIASRAINLESSQIIMSRIQRVKNEYLLAEMNKPAPILENSEEETDAPQEEYELPGAAVVGARIQDDSGFISRLAETGTDYLVRVQPAVSPFSLANRRATAIAQNLLVNEGKLKLTDFTFLSAILEVADEKEDVIVTGAEAAAFILLPPRLGVREDTYMLMVRNLTNRQDLDLGKLVLVH